MDSVLNAESLDNYIKGLTNLDAEDPDFVDDVQEVQRMLAANPEFAGKVPNFKAYAIGGSLHFSMPEVKGKGACEKKGTGAFYTDRIPKQAQGGTYKLWFQRTTFKLELYTNGGLFKTVQGVGAQKGLSNRGGRPWEGTWS